MGLAQTLCSLRFMGWTKNVDSLGIAASIFSGNAANDSLMEPCMHRLAADLRQPQRDKRQRTCEHKQLRIVQREPLQQPARLVISGRMADVCAALENLAAQEKHPGLIF